jgi:hypothetical protein
MEWCFREVLIQIESEYEDLQQSVPTKTYYAVLLILTLGLNSGRYCLLWNQWLFGNSSDKLHSCT